MTGNPKTVPALIESK